MRGPEVPAACQEQALLYMVDARAKQALKSGTPTPGSAMGGHMDQRNAAVHLSHREELDEELHDPGGDQPCSLVMTLAWCEGLPQVVATMRNARRQLDGPCALCIMRHPESYLYSSVQSVNL